MSNDRLRPKSWQKFQHYRHRNPPWIKLHRDLLDNRAFMLLATASKALLPMLWLLACESGDGTIEGDLSEIAFRLRMSEKDVKSALEPLLSAGFMERVLAGASKVRTSATSETETETETEVPIPECVKPAPPAEPEPPPDFLRFWEAYGRRGSRKQSLAAWEKLRPTPEMVEQVIAAASRYRGSVSAPNYQRHAERWIRDEGWNDVVPSKAPSLQLTVNGRAVVEASKQHIPNMPLGAASCQCQGCVDYRSRRAAQ